jgi:hypothetical protein
MIRGKTRSGMWGKLLEFVGPAGAWRKSANAIAVRQG